jgi:repressor LexA
MARAPRGQSRERIFSFVRERLLAGNPPTVREVQAAMGFRAVQTAREHLEALVKEGRLHKAPGRSRGYRLPDDARRSPPAVLVPLLGRVQAGAFTAAFEEPDGYVSVQSRLPKDELFALRVRGASMRDAGILEGDVVIVRRQASAENGEIVVALVDDEATVKRLRREVGRVVLLPDNPAFEPIVVEGELSLLGKVVEVRRFLEGEPFVVADDPERVH